MANLPAVKGYGPGCPSCGSIRSACQENGWSEPDDHYLRRKKCSECGEGFVTAEVVVPPGRTTFYRLDYRGRHNRRRYYRERKSRTKRQLPQLTKPSDQLHVSIRVTTQGVDDHHCMRGHPWVTENIYVNPASGQRACRECRRITQREYYRARRLERVAASKDQATSAEPVPAKAA